MKIISMTLMLVDFNNSILFIKYDIVNIDILFDFAFNNSILFIKQQLNNEIPNSVTV